MQQPNEDIQTIDLEPLGGGEVTTKEVEDAARNIFNELKKLGKDSSQTDENAVMQPDTPAFDTGQLTTYAMYGIGGVTAVYLIGKALE